MRLAGHVTLIADMRNSYKYLVGKSFFFGGGGAPLLYHQSITDYKYRGKVEVEIQ